MKKIRIILTFLLALNFSGVFAHRDRIERPITYRFVFQNQNLIVLSNPSDSVLKVYSNDIENGKRKLISAELLFSTGEILTFKNDGAKWTEISISYDKKVINIPNRIIEKISEIHFMTIALLWDGIDKNAFDASYFYIRFDIGTKKSFNKYPYLELFFRSKTFNGAKITRQINENSTQWADF
jgi:hypothetical protein